MESDCPVGKVESVENSQELQVVTEEEEEGDAAAANDTNDGRIVSPKGVVFDLPQAGDKNEERSPKKAVFIVPPPCGMADSVTPAKLSDAKVQKEPNNKDLLVVHRVSKFKNPHQIDRSNVDPDLELQFIETLRAGDFDDAVDLLRTHVLSGKLLLTTNSLSTAIMIGDLGILKTMILYPMVDFTTMARAPVCEAVLKQDVRMTKLLLLSPVTDVNKGSPVARAVEFGNYELVKVLLQSDRINPNKGGALYRAIGNEAHYDIVKLLLAHKRVNVNKFCGGVGSTPLCRAVNLRAIPMLILLLSHPKIDINKGFLLTPLQHAVDTGCEQIVRLLISAETPTPLEPNKKLGASVPPLAMAVQSAVPSLGIIKLLLGISKLKIDSETLQTIEARGLHEVEALVIESKRSIPLGGIWRKRVFEVLINCLLITISQLASLVWIASLAKDGLWFQFGVMLTCLFLGHLFICVMLLKRPNTSIVKAAAAPKYRCIPVLYDIWLTSYCTRLVLNRGQPTLRTGVHELLVYNNLLCQLMVCLPQLIIQITLLLVSAASDDDNGTTLVLMLAIVFNLIITVKGFVGLVLRRREEQHKEVFEPCEKQQLRYTPQLLPIDVSFSSSLPTAEDSHDRRHRTPDNMNDSSVTIRRRQRPPGLNLELITKDRTLNFPNRVKCK